ncbi:hypothetical protein EVAR_99797_1 [Eumeta japonica]|uniref:Uncharacterized protein n=1 Tax=Eumeta variegata TaxID=151549 RepID=A0A4C1ZGL8_EUMVA|nr:hypothetical protein EVAR_99797_1 [Eumeta japonica]
MIHYSVLADYAYEKEAIIRQFDNHTRRIENSPIRIRRGDRAASESESAADLSYSYRSRSSPRRNEVVPAKFSEGGVKVDPVQRVGAGEQSGGRPAPGRRHLIPAGPACGGAPRGSE